MQRSELLPLLLAGSCALSWGCAAPSIGSRSGGPTLYENAVVWVDARAQRPVQALLVEHGRIVATGPAATTAALERQGLARVDLMGRVVVPGLQDAHGHVENLGAMLETVQLVDCASYAELVARVVERARELPSGAWIEGRGWDQTRWAGADFPHHAELSRAVPEHPVFLKRVDGHAALVNARALAIAGLDAAFASGDSLAVEGGLVHLDPNGPTGVLIDRAMDLVDRHRPEPDDGTRRRRLLAAQRVLLSAGLVGVHDMGLSPGALATIRALEDEGLWKLRIIGYLWANEGLPPELAAAHPSEQDRDLGARVRVVGAKLMLDGALGSRGAALVEAYADAPDEYGHLLMDRDTFEARLERCLEAGLQPAVHAIGDRANRVLLDCYAERFENGTLEGLRPRVEHAQVVSSADWGRFDTLGVIASMQPTHATSDMRWAEARLGPERSAGAYAWRRLARDPATLVFGSDFPVENHAPLLGLYAARTRQDARGRPAGGWYPDQCLSAREALAAFTSGPAFAAHEESVRGDLHPGQFASFTVLDVDPIRDPPQALLDALVWMCVIDGEVVYRR